MGKRERGLDFCIAEYFVEAAFLHSALKLRSTHDNFWLRDKEIGEREKEEAIDTKYLGEKTIITGAKTRRWQALFFSLDEISIYVY